MERANAVAIYDATHPVRPRFMQWLPSGVRPEGVLFINASESPTGSLLVISSEDDGTVRAYTTD